MFSLSATVFDRRITHLRWEHAGRSYSAWSSIDFNYLRGATSWETANASYMVLLGVGDTTSKDFEASNQIMREAGIDDYEPKRIPDASVFTPRQVEYLIESAPDEDAAAFEAIDALHDYYERNTRQLQIDYRNTQRLNAARERHEAAHPEPPRKAVLNFWMIPGGQPR